MNCKNELLKFDLEEISNSKIERNKVFSQESLSQSYSVSLFFDEKKGYKIFTNDLGYAYGEIEINKSGNGFIHTKDGHIIFISNEDLNGALDGDLVIISSIDFGRKKDFKGVVYKVLKRKNGNVMFEVIGNGYKATLVPCNKNEIVPITINKNEYKKSRE